jgi:hypothetical protein
MMPWMDYIRSNFLLKLFSLALAILIWLAIRAHLQSDTRLPWNPLKNIETREFTLPVKLLIAPGQGQGFKVNPTNVTVIVSGEVTIIKKLTASKIQVYARIDEAKGPMMSDFPLEAKLPGDITLETLQPERATVETAPVGLMLFPLAPIY